MRLSIIVPVYKEEKYILECFQSLMEQDLQDDLEFIFIDDASPDKSMEILRDSLSAYPDRNNQIKIVENKTNLGIALTRKRALSFATGDYVGWCDSDDWCEPTMYRRLLEATHNGKNDVVICDFWYENESSVNEQEYVPVGSPEEVFLHGSLRSFPCQLWSTLIRKPLLVEAFDKIYPSNSGEDVFSLVLAIFQAKTIQYVSEPLYHHRILPTSLSHNIDHSRSQWICTLKNLQLIDRVLSIDSRFAEFVRFWKKNRKLEYRSSFKSLWEYYWTFRDLGWHVLAGSKDPLLIRLKVFFVNNCFLAFWLYNRAKYF